MADAETQVLSWRELMEKHHSALVDELGSRIDADVLEAAGHATTLARAEADLRIAESRRALADSLQQSIRRLRQTSGELRILKTLNEVSAPWAPQSVVVVFENHQARAVALRGVSQAAQAQSEGTGPHPPDMVSSESGDTSLVFDIASAPAVVSAIESRDPVVALLSPRELSAPLADALGVDPGSRAWLYPILVRQGVVAVLIAAGSVSAPQLELLCDAAAMRLEAAAPAPPSAPNLVQIDEPPAAAGDTEKLAWDDLTADQQRLHLQAQRMARLRTAEMRLYQPDALQAGLSSGDIYTALKSQIDAARSEFLNTYLAKSPTMVDYLHLEILRTLARDDDTLLGAAYPGPMV